MVDDGGPWDNATINNLLKIKVNITDPDPDKRDEVLIKGVFCPAPTACGALSIDRGLKVDKDVLSLGNLSTESPTILHFSTYTNCVNSDIGKPVYKNGSPLPLTVLINYSNEHKKWWLSRPFDDISNGSVLTINGGTGSGTVDETVMKTGGGAVMIGKGYEDFSDPPRICLTNGDTLYITNGSSQVPGGIDAVTANLKAKHVYTTNNVSVGANLNVSGVVTSNLRIEKPGQVYFTLDSTDGTGSLICLGLQNSTKAWFGVGTCNDVYITAASGYELQLHGTKISTYNDLEVKAGCVINKSSPSLKFQTSGSDKLQIYFDGSNSFINTTTGTLNLVGKSQLSLHVTDLNGRIWIMGGKHFIPESEGGSVVGQYPGLGEGHYFSVVAAYSVYGHQAEYFDAYDDLELVKQWGEPNPQISDNYDESKVKPPSNDLFRMLRGKHPETGEYNENDFFDLGSLNSFALGCAKKLAKKQDEHSATLLELFNEKERLSQEISDLRLQLQKLSSQRGTSA